MTETTTDSSKRPSHSVFNVREGKDGGKGFWVEIGAAWTNRDGSLSVALDAVPVNGRMVIRERRDGDQAGQGNQPG